MKVVRRNFLKWFGMEEFKKVKHIVDRKKHIKYVNTVYAGGERKTIKFVF